MSDSHILSKLQIELTSQIKTVKEVSKQIVEALTFYKDLNELAGETEYEDADIFCAHLNAFLADWSNRMQTEVLHTD